MIRAALFDGPGQPFRIVESPTPALGDGEALVKVSLATVCGSDLHTIDGKRTEPTPCVLGHEAVGVIEDVRGTVKDVRGDTVAVGDRVAWTVAASCKACFFCTHDLPQKCAAQQKYGHVRHDDRRGPSGSFASHVHLWPGTGLVKVPANIPDAVASPSACATATVAGSIRFIPEAETILVLGCGLLGLTACAMARAAGKTAFAVDGVPERVALARAFGAADGFALPAELEKLKSAVGTLPGRGVDAALEYSGSTELTATALAMVRTGGTMILVGAVFPTPPLSLKPEQLIRRCLTLRGQHNYTPADLLKAVEFLTVNHAKFPFADAASTRFSLNELDAAADHAKRQRPLRVAIAP